MANNIQIYNENWLYDSKERVYVARGFLTQDRIEDAAEKAGFDAKYKEGELVVKSLYGLEALFKNLSPAFPNSFSISLTDEKYERFAAWAEQNDPEFSQSTLRDFEVVSTGNGLFGVVFSSYPETFIQDVDESSINSDFAYKIREVAELG